MTTSALPAASRLHSRAAQAFGLLLSHPDSKHGMVSSPVGILTVGLLSRLSVDIHLRSKVREFDMAAICFATALASIEPYILGCSCTRHKSILLHLALFCINLSALEESTLLVKVGFIPLCIKIHNLKTCGRHSALDVIPRTSNIHRSSLSVFDLLIDLRDVNL